MRTLLMEGVTDNLNKCFMTSRDLQLEKAINWFEMNGYEVSIDRYEGVFVGIDENLMVEITEGEIQHRAILWDEALKMINELDS